MYAVLSNIFFKKAGTASRSSPSKGVRFLSDAGSGADNPRARLLDLGTSYIPPCQANKHLGISTTVCNHLSFSSNFLYH